VIPYEKNVVAARKSRGLREFADLEDLPGTHFDGRSINRERPFLVGLGRVIFRPTNDSNWIESGPDALRQAARATIFSNVIAPRSFGPKQRAAQARTFLRSWPLPSNTLGAIISL